MKFAKVLRLPRQLEHNSMCNQKLQEAIESTWAVETVLHEAHPGLGCQHSLPLPRSSMAHVAQIPKVTSLAPANHAYVRAEHSAGSSAAAQCSNDTKQRGQRQQHRQVAATSRHKPQRQQQHTTSRALSSSKRAPAYAIEALGVYSPS